MDNHWQGSARQKLLSLISPFTLGRAFEYCWVPGTPQVEYAKKLGFPIDKIFPGFYCCDLDRFNAYFDESIADKEKCFPKRIICVARYIPSKNYSTLWNAFIKWDRGIQEGWELWCAGTGVEFESRRQHPNIKHLGFVNPENWKEIISETGVFILPSIFEPWGVVVQEFAAAGFPLIISEQVGSATQFLNAQNGFSFSPENETQLISCFDRISSSAPAKLLEMGKVSHQLAQSASLDQWVQTIFTIRNGVA
jgi:glycosyltransferase involved in cell wall biosynthesis